MNTEEQKIFVSTGAFLENSLENILNYSADNQSFIELSSGVVYDEKNQMHVTKAIESGKFNFLVHNYYPIPEESFVLNLASSDQKTLSRSIGHCMEAIKLSAELGAPFYSVHCGFCFHAGAEHLGMDQTKLERFSMEIAHDIFVESLKYLSDYAQGFGIDILIENNVLAPFNLIDGCNELLLGVTSDDVTDLLQSIGRKNVGLLLDVGHLKVSAQSLGFSPELFIQSLGGDVHAIHLSDNDGCSDSNQVISEDSWFWETLIKEVAEDTVWILEVYKIPSSVINSQLALVRKKLEDKLQN